MIHVPGTRPAFKMDLHEPAWAPTCSCGWDPGGVFSESQALRSAQQHADAKNPLCPCGQPLHYTDAAAARQVQALVDSMGEEVCVTTDDGTFRVSRHYIALHGLKADDVALLGFPRVVGRDPR